MFQQRTHGRITRFRPLRAVLWLLKLPFRVAYWLVLRMWSGVGKVPARITDSFPEFPRELHRPAVFTLMFWSAFALTFTLWPFLSVGGVRAVILTVGIMAAIYLLWRSLPWNPGASATEKLLAPALLVMIFLLDRVVTGTGLMFYSVAFANGVFLFGFRRGIWFAFATLGVICVDVVMIVGVLDVTATISSMIVNALLATFLYGLVAVFVIGICASIIEAVQRREESEDLLSKLETAHADLKEYTGRVRELTLSAERARMAREMHDSVGHYLTVVNVQLEAANKFMDSGVPGDSEKARAELQKAKRLASEALSEVRRSVRALKPLAVDEGRSTSETLGELIEDFAGNGPSVSLSVSGEERDLPAEVEVALYRTLQESLTNVLKHSNAKTVEVLLYFDPDSVRLSIVDDGHGTGTNGEDGGFGLNALGERTNELGGTMDAGDAEHGGFTVEVSLPVRES